MKNTNKRVGKTLLIGTMVATALTPVFFMEENKNVEFKASTYETVTPPDKPYTSWQQGAASQSYISAEDGRPFGLGANYELGINSGVSKHPVDLTTLSGAEGDEDTKFVKLSTGTHGFGSDWKQSQSILIDDTGHLWAFGRTPQNFAEFGNNNNIGHHSPLRRITGKSFTNVDEFETSVNFKDVAISIARDAASFFAIDNSGNIWVWGALQSHESNFIGHLGLYDDYIAGLNVIDYPHGKGINEPIKLQDVYTKEKFDPISDVDAMEDVSFNKIKSNRGITIAQDTTGDIWTFGSTADARINSDHPYVVPHTGFHGFHTSGNGPGNGIGKNKQLLPVNSSKIQAGLDNEIFETGTIIDWTIGAFASHVLFDDGSIWATGDSTISGEYGAPDPTPYQHKPEAYDITAIPGSPIEGKKFISIESHLLSSTDSNGDGYGNATVHVVVTAIEENGNVWAWGSDRSGIISGNINKQQNDLIYTPTLIYNYEDAPTTLTKLGTPVEVKAMANGDDASISIMTDDHKMIARGHSKDWSLGFEDRNQVLDDEWTRSSIFPEVEINNQGGGLENYQFDVDTSWNYTDNNLVKTTVTNETDGDVIHYNARSYTGKRTHRLRGLLLEDKKYKIITEFDNKYFNNTYKLFEDSHEFEFVSADRKPSIVPGTISIEEEANKFVLRTGSYYHPEGVVDDNIVYKLTMTNTSTNEEHEFIGIKQDTPNDLQIDDILFDLPKDEIKSNINYHISLQMLDNGSEIESFNVYDGDSNFSALVGKDWDVGDFAPPEIPEQPPVDPDDPAWKPWEQDKTNGNTLNNILLYTSLAIIGVVLITWIIYESVSKSKRKGGKK